MASKIFVFALFCIAFVAVAQSVPQYATGDEPTYDEDDGSDDLDKVHSTDEDQHSTNEDDYESLAAGLTDQFDNASDPGRRLGDGQQPSQSESSSGANE
ncbi:uncharacterized protein LOC128726904 [Anopheles nili]|uniref:uncharacterized protein LOC128726904 n=1 Tax=Anopheles nili TaxID=185578 RepID=UPI00237C21C1|nr:uncharacterized protein LOC128726904 [Anopheles nili]